MSSHPYITPTSQISWKESSMKTKYLFVLIFCVIAIAGCYTATMETGLVPSNMTIKKNWAASWVYGLVPPNTVETAAQCPHGVAKVMTQLSFPNQLVGFLTFGIYTPMTIQVTCARASETSLVEPKDAFAVSKDASPKEFRNVFMTSCRESCPVKKRSFCHDPGQEPQVIHGQPINKRPWRSASSGWALKIKSELLYKWFFQF